MFVASDDALKQLDQCDGGSFPGTIFHRSQVIRLLADIHCYEQHQNAPVSRYISLFSSCGGKHCLCCLRRQCQQVKRAPPSQRSNRVLHRLCTTGTASASSHTSVKPITSPATLSTKTQATHAASSNGTNTSASRAAASTSTSTANASQ